jgi:hypothetical protein
MACRGAGRSAAFVDGEFGIAQVAIVIDQIMRAIVVEKPEAPHPP